MAGRRAGAYCASKDAVVRMTRTMALDHAREAIRVDALCPGDTETPMLDAENPRRRPRARGGAMRGWRGDPHGPVATPLEVAGVMLFLASDAARYITGAALPVEGGHSAVQQPSGLTTQRAPWTLRQVVNH